MIYKHDIITRLEAITKNVICSHILVKPNGKNKTISFFNIDLNKYQKCTLINNVLISNIRDEK